MNDGVGGYRPVSRADGYNARDDLARWINGGVVGAWSYGHKGGVDAIDGENNVQMR